MITRHMTSLDFQPVIIIGAARSGTNMLRDALTRLPRVATWPCDEINYVWRHRHARFPTDELRPEHATPPDCAYIRSVFASLAQDTNANWVVEKTCANSLRVEFIRKVLPEAKFVFLVRDGRDVVASALKRWHVGLDLRYTLRKARFVPARDLPFYAWQYLRRRAHRHVSRERRLASWGPRFVGMDDLLKNCSLAEVCAEQWRQCVERAALGLEAVSADRLCTIRYEDFVRSPVREFSRICSFLGASVSSDQVTRLLRQVSESSIGNWRAQLDPNQLTLVMARLGTTLEKWGYINPLNETRDPGSEPAAQVIANRVALACAASSGAV
jgi:hypothetical protein